MNFLKSLAMNYGPLSEMIRGRASAVLEDLLLPAVEDRGLESLFVAQMRNRHLL
jgi:hypothetical protein